MSIFSRPVSEAYYPEAPHQLVDVAPEEHHEAWGFCAAREVDENGDNVPHRGTTVIYRLYEAGMTPPAKFIKPEHHAGLDLSVLAGRGMLIRALASGATETIGLEEDGKQASVEAGQAYSIVNTGKKDLLLRGVMLPAWRPGDEVELTKSGPKPEKGVSRYSETTSYAHVATTDGKLKSIALPTSFYDQVGQAAAGKFKYLGTS